MQFAHKNLLLLLLLIPPAMVVFFWWSWRKRQELMTQFIRAQLLPSLTVGISSTRQKFRLALLVLAAVCIILALARPQWGFHWEASKQRGLDIVVAIDTSKSMLAEDITPNRLARAKLAALDLMQQAKSDRLGLVAFAGSAFLQCPLTIDDSAFRQSVESLDVGTIPQGGTALADAIQTSLSAFKQSDNYKILVLFTDGEDQDSGALEAVKKAAEAGLRIYTIGIGTAEGELLRIKDGKGRTDYVRDEQGNVVKSHLNEKLLQDIAGATQGGFYLPLRGAKAIDTLYQQGLAKLPKSEHEERLTRQYHERYHWPLALAILFLLAEMLLPEGKRETRVRRVKATGMPGKTALSAAAALTVLILLPASVVASPSSALREYNSGKYEQALKEYDQLLQKNGDDPRLHFNAGAAAYKNRQFEEAAKRFNDALATPDLKLQQHAHYNRGNSLFHLGEAAQDPAKRNENWQNALQDYESTLKLNPADHDARFNYDFVKKKLEELKQQQQQQQQSKSDQQKNQNQDQQQKQQQQEQAKQDEQKKDENSQSQQNQSQEQQQKNQQAQKQEDQQKQQQTEQQQQRQAKKSEEQKKEQQKQEQQAQQSQAQQQQGQPEDKDQDQNEKAYAAGEMTPRQAQQLLDAQKGEEKLIPPQPKGELHDRTRPIRDW